MSKHATFFIAITLAGVLAGCSVALADHGVSSVSYEALGAAEPSLLPSSPFYFLKEWRRKITLLFTFNEVKKAKREVEFVSEKAAELKALAEKEPQNSEAIARAVENYRAAKERARERLTSLTNNPNAAELLKKMAERAASHEALFAELQERFADTPEVKEKVTKVREEIKKQTPAVSEPIPQTAAPAPSGGTTSVGINNFAFNPKEVRLPTGTRVIWTNNDRVAHTVTADNGSFESGLLKKGDTFNRTFTEKGTYSYHCTPHPFMVGTIIVE